MRTVCSYCGRELRHSNLGAPTEDSRAWGKIQAQHAEDCAWAWSRGFKAPSMPDKPRPDGRAEDRTEG